MRYIRFYNPQNSYEYKAFKYLYSKVNGSLIDFKVNLDAATDKAIFKDLCNSPFIIASKIEMDATLTHCIGHVTTDYSYYQRYTSTYMAEDKQVKLPVGYEDEAGYISKKDIPTKSEPITGITPRTYKDDMKDFFFGEKDYNQRGPKCTCGVDAVGQGLHSDYCARKDYNTD